MELEENMEELSRLSLLIGQEQIRKLSETNVLVLGLGGVGGYTVEALARSGIGHLILVDYDKIDITNTNRQIIALKSTIGKSKIAMWKQRILDIRNTCQITTIEKKITKENLEELFKNKIDFVVDACDTIEVKYGIIKYCLKQNVPFISCLGTGKRMDSTMLEITDLSKTNYDPIARILRKKIKEDQIKAKIPVVWSREIPKKINSDQIPSSIFVPSVAGILCANYIVNQIIKQEGK